MFAFGQKKYEWDVVDFDETEPLVENSDNTKKICKAIKEGRTQKERRKKDAKVRKIPQNQMQILTNFILVSKNCVSLW